MAGVIDAIKNGRYNESASAKLLMTEQQQKLQVDLETMQGELESLRKENAGLKVTSTKGVEL